MRHLAYSNEAKVNPKQINVTEFILDNDVDHGHDPINKVD